MTKIALCVGIEYWLYASKGYTGVLPGCHRDAKNFSRLFRDVYKFDEVITMIDDDETAVDLQPTKKNMERQLALLLEKAHKEKGLEIAFTYSGHGTHMDDADGEEADGQDEQLVPLNYHGGFITDDYIRDEFVSKLPEDAKLTAVMDCCHSGSVLDLRYTYRTDGEGNIKEEKAVNIASKSQKSRSAVKAKTMALSGCLDEQTSLSVIVKERGNLWMGALSWAVLTALKENDYDIGWFQLQKRVIQLLDEKNYEQRPLISNEQRLSKIADQSLKWKFALWDNSFSEEEKEENRGYSNVFGNQEKAASI